MNAEVKGILISFETAFDGVSVYEQRKFVPADLLKDVDFLLLEMVARDEAKKFWEVYVNMGGVE